MTAASVPHSSKAHASARLAEILLVEDNPGDQLLTQEAFKAAPWANPPHILSNGDDALAFVRRNGRYRDATAPDLIILDYNLPGKSGPELAQELKRDEKLRNVPIVIFSTMGETKNIAKSYELGADSYLRKPDDIDAYFRALQGLEGMWRSALEKSSTRRSRRLRASAAWSFIPTRARREMVEWALIVSVLAILMGLFFVH